MYGLTFVRSTAEAAELCAETLGMALGARAVLIHLQDLRRCEFRVIGACGNGHLDVLGFTSPGGDPVVSALLSTRAPVTMSIGSLAPAAPPKRLQVVGAVHHVVAVPVLSWRRCLAMIEVVDPSECHPAQVIAAASYVANQFAAFLAEK